MAFLNPPIVFHYAKPCSLYSTHFSPTGQAMLILNQQWQRHTATTARKTWKWYWDFLLLILFVLIVVSFLKFTPSMKHPSGEHSKIISMSTKPFRFQSKGFIRLRRKVAETGASATTDISRDFPSWKDGALINPMLQALGITFRLVSMVQADPHLYANGFEWKCPMQLMTSNEIKLITLLFEDGEDVAETRATIPMSSAIDMSIINYDDDHGMKSVSVPSFWKLLTLSLSVALFPQEDRSFDCIDVCRASEELPQDMIVKTLMERGDLVVEINSALHLEPSDENGHRSRSKFYVEELKDAKKNTMTIEGFLLDPVWHYTGKRIGTLN
ncbi:hypothetical protein NE237_024591 [Protea cynaroides]|uniref:Nematode resistance protein-like HSPRO1 N-terminal domain-containing protein n=1 Tax=Protea cynaroides TaxID=273540 RepID=A0A9Q0H1F4_9MAGN|nr:hypothetical protein NE237_024591 [Protea cynaroides]